MSGESRLQKGFREPGDKPRRFYTSVTVVEISPLEGGGYAVQLDGRNVRGPQGGRVVLPTRALAEQVAEEWAGQGERLEIAGMHASRLANSAIESVPAARDATAQSVADYAASDLVCYFAEAPSGLVERQIAGWTPMLTCMEDELGLTFLRAAGIVHRPQPPQTLAAVKALALGLDDFGLTGLAFGAALFGSGILGIALLRGWLSGEEAFDLSRLDEAWQADQWGVDDEAAERTQRLRGEAGMLDRWFRGLAST